MRVKTEKWVGGRKYRDANGRERWVIRKTVAGIAYDLALSVETEREAVEEFGLFRANPAAYSAARKQTAAVNAVRLDDATVEQFTDYLEQSGRSPGYVRDVTGYLAAWDAALHGRELRTLDAKTTKRLLASWETAHKSRTIAFKSFCSWLVEQGQLDVSENPGRFLTVPSARRTHETKGYAIAAVERLYAALPTQAVRDTLCLRAKTGMHGTEIERLAAGDGAVRELDGYGEIAGTIAFRHKTGRPKILSLDSQALAAAKRLQKRGRAPDRHTIREAVERACSKDKALEFIDFGALRHSFATWLAECGRIYQPHGTGLPLDAIAQALGHTSARTTILHYLSVQVPPLYLVPIRLEHADDP